MSKDNFDKEGEEKDAGQEELEKKDTEQETQPEGIQDDSQEISEDNQQHSLHESGEDNQSENQQPDSDQGQNIEGNSDTPNSDSPNENDGEGAGNKINWGYIALIIVIAVVIFFGMKNVIWKYFSGETKEAAPKVMESPELDNSKPTPTSSNQLIGDEQDSVKPSKINQQVEIDQKDMNADSNPPSNEKASMKSSEVNPQVAIEQKDVSMNKETKSIDQDTVKAIVKDFIKKNPKVIADSLIEFEKQNMEKEAKESQKYLSENSNAIFKDKPFLGNKDGTISMVEFFDYRCVYCHKVYPTLVKLMQEYTDLKITLIPLTFMGDVSVQAAKFSLAVFSLYPNKFYDFHSDLINSDSINEKVIFDLIEKHKFNKNKLVEEANSDRINNIIRDNLEIAQKSRVQGVPSFIINGEFVSGAMQYNNFKQLIDKSKSTN